MTVMRHRVLAPLFAAPCVLAASLAPAVQADFVRMDIRDVSAELGTPPGLRTHRVFALFDDPDDRVTFVGAPEDRPFVLYTNASTGLWNDAGPLAGSPADDLPNAPKGAAWDTWVTIGGDQLGTPVALSPGFAGVEGVAAFVGPLVVSERGGWMPTAGPVQAGDDGVLIAQITVLANRDFAMRGAVSWLDDGGRPGSAEFDCSSQCPGGSSPRSTVRVSCGAADVDGDRDVDFGDVVAVLSHFGPVDPAWRFLPGNDAGDDGTVHEVRAFVSACEGCLQDDRSTEIGVGTTGFDAAALADGNFATSSVLASVGLAVDGTRFELLGQATATAGGPCGVRQGDVRAVARSLTRLEVLRPVPFTYDATVLPGADVRFGGPSLGREVEGSAARSGLLQPGLLEMVAAIDFAPIPGFSLTSTVLAGLTIHDGGQRADIDADGVVDFDDLLTVLGTWGPCGE